MLHRPVTLRSLPFILLGCAAIYIVVAACANANLLLYLAMRPLTQDTLLTAMSHADFAVTQWVVALVAICFVFAVGAGASDADQHASGHSVEHDFSSPHWRASDDESDSSFSDSSWLYDYESHHVDINPATGLPMCGATDICGHSYGACD